MPRFILEAEWSGYSAAQRQCVHREVIKADRAKRHAAPNAVRNILFTDGTGLTITVREAEPRERVEEKRGYVSLIREAEEQGRRFVRVADLPGTGGGRLMARDLTFLTTLSLGIFDGGEFELSLLVIYRFTKAYPATAIDPGEPARAEIQKLRLLAEDGTREFPVPQWLESLIETDEALHDSLVADALEDAADAREAAAEARAEAYRMEARS